MCTHLKSKDSLAILTKKITIIKQMNSLRIKLVVAPWLTSIKITLSNMIRRGTT